MTAYTERALKRISPIYDQSLFIKELFDAVGSPYDSIRSFFETLRQQRYIDSVTWGIVYQELKYSLEPRPDLSLEERRRRLGIRARTHRPLNPAVVEKSILELFGIRSYIYEGQAGWLHVWAQNLLPGARAMIEWLLTEKPAHLKLGLTLSLTLYLGAGSLPSQIFYTPAAPLALPLTPDDKKNYPRLSAGIAQITTGSLQINAQAPNPDDLVATLKAGVAQRLSGSITLNLTAPNAERLNLHAGICRQVTGELTICAAEKPGFIPLEEPEDLFHEEFVVEYPLENPHALLAFANLALARGKFFFPSVLPEPTVEDDDLVRIFFDFPQSRYRRVRVISMPHPRKDLSQEEIKEVGQYVVDNELLINAQSHESTQVFLGALRLRKIIKIL